MFKKSVVVAVFAAAVFAAVPASAGGGCRPGDTLVTVGPHAGQCVHKGPAVSSNGASFTWKKRVTRTRAPADYSTRSVAPSVRPVPVATSDPSVTRTRVEHPFKDVPTGAQFRCNADGAPASPGTGWCHN